MAEGAPGEEPSLEPVSRWDQACAGHGEEIAALLMQIAWWEPGDRFEMAEEAHRLLLAMGVAAPPAGLSGVTDVWSCGLPE